MVIERKEHLLADCPQPFKCNSFINSSPLPSAWAQGEPTSLKGKEPSTLNVASYENGNSYIYIHIYIYIYDTTMSKQGPNLNTSSNHLVCLNVFFGALPNHSGTFSFQKGIKQD